jgi:hypothetical protein
MKDIFTPEVRKWIYSIIGVTTPLLVTLGIISNTVAGHVVAIAAAVLGLGSNFMARANVTTPEIISTEEIN